MKRLNKKNINTPQYFDKQFSEKEVDKINTLRQKMYLKEMSELKGVKKVVELACGVSYFCQMASKKYKEVWGLDFSALAMQKMKNQFPNVNYVVGDACNTPFRDSYFDVVVAGEIIEHLEHPKKLISEMYRIVRNRGMIILSTPKIEFNDPEHLWEINESDLEILFKNYGKTKIRKIESKIFKGREYYFAICKVNKKL